MDVVVIFNGLGNQMSQYAFYRNKKRINKSSEYISFCSDHNGLELDRVFNINFKATAKQRALYYIFRILLTDKILLTPLQWLLKVFNCSIIKENFNYHFNGQYLLPSKGIRFYYGGWHSEKYFLSIREQLLELFTLNEPDDDENINNINAIKTSNSIAVHIRRGDYLDSNNVNLFGKVCTLEYYKAAINLMESKQAESHFFVFSNDIEWVKANIVFNKVTYITCNKGLNSWKDMFLMSICKHNIVANSSFSWWGAWLNKNTKKIVVSPSRYLNDDKSTDFYPESWIKIANY